MMKKLKNFMSLSVVFCLMLGVLLPSFTVSAASIQLAPVFSHNMVLQRDKEICVYGTGSGTVSVTLGNKTKQVTSEGGSWQIRFDAMSATSSPINFSYSFGGATYALSNVVVGDVFVASGQSNMEMTLSSTEQADSRAYSSPLLRFTTGSGWQSFTAENLQDVTAIGVMFAQEIENALAKDIPVGIISASVGASRVDDWTSEEYCVCDKYLSQPHSDYTYYDKGHHDLYKRYIEPITSFSIAGVLWYQGESNRGEGEALYYYDMFENMVNCWREAWNDDSLPFYTVQIMLYTGNDGVDIYGNAVDEYNIRIAQGEAARTIKNVTVCTMLSYEDTLLPDGSMNIHPTDKLPIAKALANAAIATYYKPKGDYSKAAPEYSGPLYKEVSISGNTAAVTFDHADGLALSSGDTVTEFELRDGSGKWVKATGTVSGNTVTLTAGIGTASGVRLGYSNSPRINLRNSAGYYASPFVWIADEFEVNHSASENISASGTSHWYRCTADGCDEKFNEEAHSGGTGSCTERSICSVCGFSYYSSNHGATEVRNAVEATGSAEGYTGDLYCTVCGKIVSAGTVIPVSSSGFAVWIIVAVSAVLLVAAAVTVAVILRKKKNKASSDQKDTQSET